MEPFEDLGPPQHGHMNSLVAPAAFPFNEAVAHMTTRDLLSHLPPKDEAWTLVESYYRYCAWQ